MRSQRVLVPDANLTHIAQKNDTRGIMMIINTDAVNDILLQSGPSPGDIATDGWPVPGGDVFTLDPATPVFAKAIQDDWWAISPTGNPVILKMFIG